MLAFLVGWGVLAVLASSNAREARAGSHESAKASVPARRVLTWAEIAAHDRPEDCWLVIRGKVYDVTQYSPSHPAPRRAIGDYCGRESTWAFETKGRSRPHSQGAWQLLEAYRIGEIAD
ncbi:MAG TPA: cytochrome b5-like heme/steroid binding domain-containing protein [Polyangiales bacterium]|nr:cytochrome b5-like heme/steroid binding domain-containing protein [Polyangiales bacterium]